MFMLCYRHCICMPSSIFTDQYRSFLHSPAAVIVNILTTRHYISVVFLLIGVFLFTCNGLGSIGKKKINELDCLRDSGSVWIELIFAETEN